MTRYPIPLSRRKEDEAMNTKTSDSILSAQARAAMIREESARIEREQA